jgi:hypothetical protein
VSEVEYYDIPSVNRSSVMVLPKQKYYEWAMTCPDPDPELTLDNLRREGTTFLIPELDGYLDTWFKKNFKDIFIYELDSWYTDEKYWPKKLTCKLFIEFFEVRFASIVLDIGKDVIERDEE